VSDLKHGVRRDEGWTFTIGEPSSLGVCLQLPPALELGHESQFALALAWESWGL
jgi:hypothetical protein